MKIGKTEFCTLAPDAFILAFEKGTNARPGALVRPVENWGTFKQIIRLLENKDLKTKFATICIDTIGIAWEACEQFVCQQNGVQKLSEIPFGGGYSACSKEFENALRKITMMGYGLIMTCHLKETYDENGMILAATPDLNNRCLKIVNGLADVIGVITQTWNEKGESERWIQTRATRTITAGSRFKYLAPKIPFSYEKFVEALSDAIDAEVAHGAKAVDHLEINTSQQLSFAEVRQRASELWDILVLSGGEPNTEVGNIILKKIEIIMGHKMRLSEFTEDQTDLLLTVVKEMEELVSE